MVEEGITPSQQMLASCSGAVLTSVLVTPLDVVKIRMQAQQKPKDFTRGHCFLYCNGLMDHVCAVHGNGNGNGPNGKNGIHPECLLHEDNHAALREWFRRPCPQKFNGTMDAFVKIARNEGVTSLWSGLPPTMVMAVPATVVYFTTYDHLKYMMGFRQSDPSTRHIPVLAGSLARVFAATLISPLELVRTKMQSTQLTYAAVGRAVRDAVATDGLKSLMRGLGPTLLRDVPFSAFYWYAYEFFKAQQLQHKHSQEPTFVQSFSAGAAAGTIAAVITLPFDVIKTHRQIELGEAGLGSGKSSSSTWKLIARLYRQQGMGGIFAGLGPRVLKVAPACAIMISSYEYGKAFFRKLNRQRMNEQSEVVVS